jgi:hypothetical protein
MPQTFANSINNNLIYADRAEHDAAGNDIATTYATKGEIPSVPVTDVEVDGVSVVSSGVASITMPTFTQAQANWNENDTSAASYIQNKPSIPSATSDLTNDSGFITLSDVPAQVNADWNSSSGASEILNKPTIPSGAQLVPAATSADADKVLTVDSQGTPAWASAQAPISAGDGIDITNNVVSAKVDGTTIDTNASGELTVIGGGGGGTQADWTEDDPADPSYIENKPTPKTLTAGTGISITENASTITVANTATPPTVDQTYDASSTHAQSGVAVADAIGNLGTNLSAAQIQALKEALGIDETVLWEDSAGVVLHNGITLSESRLNFEYLRLTLSCQGKSTTPMCYVDIPMDGINAGSTFQFQMDVPFNNETTATFALTWKVLMSATNTTLQSTTALYWGKTGFDGTSANAGTWTQGSNTNVPNIYKVVGVHRIASNTPATPDPELEDELG